MDKAKQALENCQKKMITMQTEYMLQILNLDNEIKELKDSNEGLRRQIKNLPVSRRSSLSKSRTRTRNKSRTRSRTRI